LCETALYRNSILQLLLDLACPKEFPATQNFCKITSIFRQVESGQFKEAWGHSARLPKTTIINLQERAKQLLRGESWNNYQPSHENVTEAKQFLLDAAEAWHIARNSAEEQRVRAWETNIKTETELSEEKLVQEPIDKNVNDFESDATLYGGPRRRCIKITMRKSV
jgi:hypothetical protein